MEEVERDLVFPENFLWGTATSAHQIEGDNTKNQWWRWEQDSSHTADGSKSGRACKHYELFEKDLDLIEILGLNCHRFSIEWSRVEPEPGVFDEETIDHYKAMLDGLHERQITTFVTLLHFTVPLWFEDAGGWLWPQAPDRFAAFARKVAEKLGSQIDYYITINEPMVVANASYLVGAHPPGHADEEEFAMVAVNLLNAHARAARVLRESATSPAAPIGLTKAITVYEAVDPNNSADLEEKERRDRLLNRWFIECLESGRSCEPLGKGEPVPGLPGSVDFIGVDYYLRARVSPDLKRMRTYYESMRGQTEQSDLGWEVYPEGIRQAVSLASHLKVPIYITANGIAVQDDGKRSRYIVSHLTALHRAIESGVDVRGYMHWTLLDDFEWALGYVPKFGLVAIQPQMYRRVAKKSAGVLKEIAMTNSIPASLAARVLHPPAPAPEPVSGATQPERTPEGAPQPASSPEPAQQPAPQAPPHPEPAPPPQPPSSPKHVVPVAPVEERQAAGPSSTEPGPQTPLGGQETLDPPPQE